MSRTCPFVLTTLLIGLLSITPLSGVAQNIVPGSKSTAHAPALTSGESRATRAFNAARALGKPELYAFLKPMPKGGDLHMHLSGAVYAETFIAEAAQQGLCVAPVEHGVPVVPEGQDALRFVKPLDGRAGNCAPGQVSAADALNRQSLYDDLVDSLSMRAFVPSEGITGHDQFFATFDRFGGLKAFEGEWLDEVATRAASQNEQYLEIMNTPTFTHAAGLGYKIGWPENPVGGQHYKEEFATLRERLLQGGLRDEVAVDRKEFADAEEKRQLLEHCHDASPLPAGASAHARNDACLVQIRFLYQVLRGFPPQQVFAQALLGFEVAQAELDSGGPGGPLVVGINFVMPEDGQISMRDYHLQMLMLDYLHSVYPRVHISLHAGELAFGMVPPAGLGFHVREAVELGHAERIGHGMDVLYETDPNQLLAEMAAKHVMIEVNLTSNDVILGQAHTDHPLAAYRAAHVPVALSTDDEGVSRIDLTHEYVKAAEEQNLNYLDLKRSARTSLEHSFLPGPDLWAFPDRFERMAGGCIAPSAPDAAAYSAPRPASRPASRSASRPAPGPACAAFLKGSTRASAQWELERRFLAFEAEVSK